MNIFKRKQTPTPAPGKSIVDQIHEDFDVAIDGFMKEVNGMIDGHLMDQGARLKQLGFRQSQQATDGEKMKAINDTALAAKRYAVEYPLYKFITDDLVSVICKKYGLVLGPTERFIGHVPEKNIKEMEQFKLSHRERVSYWSLEHIRPIFDNFGMTGWNRPDEIGFVICAPIKDFDTKGLKLSGHKLEIEDPIVLQPIKYGYLIVTKWGPEASDPGLINEKHN